jgi:hypothetical protein
MSVSDKLIIKQDGKDRELFMSFGLLSQLSKIAGTPEQVVLFTVDPDVRDEVRKAVLAKRKGGGKITEPVDDPDELDISVDDNERLLKWAVDHTLDFFVRSMTIVADVVNDSKDRLTDLASSADGLKA